MNIKKMDSKDMKSCSFFVRILAMYVDIDLSTSKYRNLKTHVSHITGLNVFLTYETMRLIKQESYPSDMKFSEDGASVDLRSLIVHTVKKILL